MNWRFWRHVDPGELLLFHDGDNQRRFIRRDAIIGVADNADGNVWLTLKDNDDVWLDVLQRHELLEIKKYISGI